MAFDPTDWIKLADELAERGEEASIRAAIGRNYYGAFLKSLLSLEYEGKIRPRGDRSDHREVVRLLSVARGRAAIALNTLARLREVADYRVNPSVTRDDLSRARAHVTAIPQMCESDWGKIPPDWLPSPLT